ncbi:hypothetical protein [Sphingomicrobium clamense]|uniref:Uncharacterized protein n=1 Tax=Sphingomicrobium clamense TaxID=2851013 RepID=A0ABS6V6E0_9SPHN|nr:hypothetical protein [Sphingomicrobium sp. B8]MBW0144920.1 hypothetical protein [Sphingomicrobium sp. B8]
MSILDFKTFILVGAGVVFGASPAMAQHATSPAPTSPTENLHRGYDQRQTTFSAQRFGRRTSGEDLRRMLFSEEAIIDANMITPSLDADIYRYAREMGDCLIESMGDEVERILGRAYTDEDGTIRIEAGDVELRTACIMQRGHLVPRETLNAALAEAFIARAEATFEDRAMSVDVNEAEDFTGLVPGAAHDFTMVGRCAAVYSPGLVQDVLATEPGSSDERDALNRLYAATPECGLAKSPRKVPTSYQRSVFATGLYHWWRRGRAG